MPNAWLLMSQHTTSNSIFQNSVCDRIWVDVVKSIAKDYYVTDMIGRGSCSWQHHLFMQHCLIESNPWIQPLIAMKKSTCQCPATGRRPTCGKQKDINRELYRTFDSAQSLKTFDTLNDETGVKFKIITILYPLTSQRTTDFKRSSIMNKSCRRKI